MKKIITLALAAILCMSTLALGSCGKKDEAKKLVVYTNAEFAPFEYVANNEVVGVDIDICKKIAEEIGADLEIVNTDFDSIIGAIASGKGDLGASGFTINAERLEQVNFTIPYFTTTQYIILPKDSEIKSVADLAGKNVAVQIGTTGDLAISKMVDDKKLEGTVITRLNNANEGGQGLGTKYDAVVIDELTAKNIAAVNGFDTIKVEGLEDEQYGIAINKANTELLKAADKVIAAMIEDGSLLASLEYHEKAATVSE